MKLPKFNGTKNFEKVGPIKIWPCPSKSKMTLVLNVLFFFFRPIVVSLLTCQSNHPINQWRAWLNFCYKGWRACGRIWNWPKKYSWSNVPTNRLYLHTLTDLVDDLDLASIKDSATPKKSCYKVWGVGIRKRSNRWPKHVRLVFVS